MNRFARVTLAAPALVARPHARRLRNDGSSIRPTSSSSEIFNTKKKLPGERRAGVPGGHAGRAAGRAAGAGQGLSGGARAGSPRRAGAEAASGRRAREAQAETQAEAESRRQADASPTQPADRRRSRPARSAVARSAATGLDPAAQASRSAAIGAWPAREPAAGSHWPDPPRCRLLFCARSSASLGVAACTRRHLHMSFTVAIVGRPNVGKSTLFNRLVGRRLALVDDQPGVTRDRREGRAQLGDLAFTVIDTAGLEEAAPASLDRPHAGADRRGDRGGRRGAVRDRRARRADAGRPRLRRSGAHAPASR